MEIHLDTALRFGTINVRGLAGRRKQYQLCRLFMEKNLDVIAVQETKVDSEEGTDRMLDPFRSRFYVCVSHAVGTAGGCALFLRSALGFSVESVYTDEGGRLIVCDVCFADLKWRIICLYAPNKVNERKAFFESVEAHLQCDEIVVMMGDFNCVCNVKDRVGSPPIHDASARYLNVAIENYNLEDVGGVMANADTTPFTHYQRNSHARLDRAYISADLIPLCNLYEVSHVSFSDHSLVIFAVGPKKSTGFNWELWKFNVKLLEDESFLIGVNDRLQVWFKTQHKSHAEAWEHFKQEVKMFAIERSSALRREEKKKEVEMQTNLNFYLCLENNSPGRYTKEIKEIKSQLELVEAERYKGAVIRARAEKLWCGEQPTKRSLGDERAYASRNEITAVTYGSVVVRDKETIRRAFYEHYCELLGHEPIREEGFDNEFLPLLPSLEGEVTKRLEESITVEEIKWAIDSLSSGKTPGPDGLSSAFYQAFKQDIAIPLHKVITEAYENCVLPPSFRQSHTVLIPKSEDTHALLSVRAYRPISLTNTDYKIYTKVLAQRLQNVIQQLVGPHQTCGIRGRSIVTNIHVARTILESCDAFSDRVALLQLDLEKAFDRVSHETLFLVLEHANIGSVLLQGVKMCYDGVSTKLIVNKQPTAMIEVKSALRQGCALSPLLFALYIEPFCLKVISSTIIRGFSMASREVKILAYADDIALFCRDKESVSNAVEVANRFCKVTGSAINWSKSLGIWHGNWNDKAEFFENMQWTVTPARYLGVPLQHYRDTNDYWQEEVEQVKVKATKFGGRNLSIFARSTVCNLFLFAKIWYVLQALCVSRMTIQKIHRACAVFIWGSTWERTSRTNLFRSVKSGGLGLVHLFLRQVVSRFIFLRDQKDPFLRTVCQVRLRDVLPQFIVSSRSANGASLRGFLREVAWSVEFLCARFSFDYLAIVGRKKLYKDLVDICMPVPLYRSMFSATTGVDVLKRVKRMPVRSGVKTFFFQLHTGTLPVKPWLQQKGLFVAWSINCILCRKPETIEHIFLDCSDALFLWDILQRTLKKDLPVTPYGIRFLPIASEDGVPYDMFMALTLHSLWKTRMDVRHERLVIRSAREHFIESILFLREACNARLAKPEWATLLDVLVCLKRF